ncbi:MAG: hypothetical protein GY810_00790 [Aureispira sp.]|nr:hypothetical protein [Aureispira sp.]
MRSSYKLSIEKVEQNRVTMPIAMVYEDSDFIPIAKNFILQLLTESFFWMQYNPAKLKLSPTVAQERIDTHPYKRQYNDWMVLKHGATEIVSVQKLETIQAMSQEELQQHPLYKNLLGWRKVEEVYHLDYRPEFRSFVNLAEVLILDIKWEGDEEYYEEGIFTFEVLEKDMLYHLHEDLSWVTNAFDFRHAY